MARKDRHTFLMGGLADGSRLESLARAGRDDGRRSDAHVEYVVRPVFFLNPSGWGPAFGWTIALVAEFDWRPTHL